MTSTFKEFYIINYTYQKDDGYWVFSEKKEIYITIKHGDNEKDNHQLAEDMFIKQNKHLKSLKINSVTYV